jgi:hypothetical protein
VESLLLEGSAWWRERWARVLPTEMFESLTFVFMEASSRFTAERQTRTTKNQDTSKDAIVDGNIRRRSQEAEGPQRSVAI